MSILILQLTTPISCQVRTQIRGASVGPRLMTRLDDGLMACPICDERMREEAVFSHLDVHNGKDATPNGYRDSAR